ncbi:MAG: twin-arginine translocase subunit TatC, partial [Pseudomonadota bacterium]
MAETLPRPDLRDADTDNGEADIEASRAPLMAHLLELRKRLLIVVAALGVSFILCFIVSAPLYNLLTIPYV